jgi:hypothetical protein
VWIDAASRSTVANYPYNVLACRAIFEIRLPIDSSTHGLVTCFCGPIMFNRKLLPVPEWNRLIQFGRLALYRWIFSRLSSLRPRNFLAFTHPDITALKRAAD